MMQRALQIPPGDHLLENVVAGCALPVKIDGERQIATVVLALGVPERSPLGGHHRATTVAIQIGPQAATELYRALRTVLDSMGLPHTKEIEFPDEMPQGVRTT